MDIASHRFQKATGSKTGKECRLQGYREVVEKGIDFVDQVQLIDLVGLVDFKLVNQVPILF